MLEAIDGAAEATTLPGKEGGKLPAGDIPVIDETLARDVPCTATLAGTTGGTTATGG